MDKDKFWYYKLQMSGYIVMIGFFCRDAQLCVSTEY